jgi:hypothetical protein
MNPPVGDPNLQHIHYGDTPEVRRLVWIPWLQAGGLLLTVFVGFSSCRRSGGPRASGRGRRWPASSRTSSGRRSRRSRDGSRCSGSLQVSVRATSPTGDRGRSIGEDLERLERISHRFELIGTRARAREPLRPQGRGATSSSTSRRASRGWRRKGVDLLVDVPPGLAARQGERGAPGLGARERRQERPRRAGGSGRQDHHLRAGSRREVGQPAHPRYGPGVDPEIRDKIFEPGVSSKPGGGAWAWRSRVASSRACTGAGSSFSRPARAPPSRSDSRRRCLRPYVLAPGWTESRAARGDPPLRGPCPRAGRRGLGKTRVLTARMCHLIHEHGVPPDRILAVTFTNKAAGEMRERIGRLLGTRAVGMWVGTFHAIGARLLRRHADRLGWDRAFSIFDADQSLRLVKSVQESVGVDPKRWSPKAIRAEISNAKNQLVGARSSRRTTRARFDLFVKNVARVYPEYRSRSPTRTPSTSTTCSRAPSSSWRRAPSCSSATGSASRSCSWTSTRTRTGAVPLRRAARAEPPEPDGRRRRRSVDLRWRGADIRNILDFEQAFPGARVVRLERNYRSTERILDAANRVISENVQRKGKTLRTERAGGEPVTLLESVDENDEARWIVNEIEARAGRRRAALSLRRRALPHERAGARARGRVPARGDPIPGRRERALLRAARDPGRAGYLRLISNPRDESPSNGW